MKEDIARSMSSFVAKVRFTDPTYQEPMSPEMFDSYLLSGLPVEVNSDGVAMSVVVVPEWMDWGYVPYVEENECCCSHEMDSCPFENDVRKGHASTMCINCVHSWENDWEVIRPHLT